MASIDEIGGHDWCSGGQRLKENEPEVFLARGKREDIAGGVKRVFEIPSHMSCPSELIRDPRRLDPRPHGRDIVIISGTGNDHSDILVSALPKKCDRIDEMLDAFLNLDPTQEQNGERRFGDLRPGTQRRSWIRSVCIRFQIDQIRNHHTGASRKPLSRLFEFGVCRAMNRGRLLEIPTATDCEEDSLPQTALVHRPIVEHASKTHDVRDVQTPAHRSHL